MGKRKGPFLLVVILRLQDLARGQLLYHCLLNLKQAGAETICQNQKRNRAVARIAKETAREHGIAVSHHRDENTLTAVIMRTIMETQRLRGPHPSFFRDAADVLTHGLQFLNAQPSEDFLNYFDFLNQHIEAPAPEETP